MGNVTNRFLLLFMNAFIMLIIFVNYLGWSGAYINIASGSSVNWDNSYFGFQSIQNMIMAINEYLNSVELLTPNHFIEYGQDVLNDITFRVPELIEGISTNNYDVLKFLNLMITLLFQPLLLFVHLGLFLGCIVWYALAFGITLLTAFGGAYNIPMGTTLDWHVIQQQYNDANQINNLRVIGYYMI